MIAVRKMEEEGSVGIEEKEQEAKFYDSGEPSEEGRGRWN